MAKAAPAAKPDKGADAEEALRRYFLSLGAFVVRGVPVTEGADSITDIDLWTYTRASVHARHISIIDVKNKKRSKGYERAIWLKGLQHLVAADEAIVASTSTRENLKPFADRVGVRVIGSQVLSAVLARYSPPDHRLSSDEIGKLWQSSRNDGVSNLASRMSVNFQEIGRGITFSALNHWIDEAGQLLTWSLDHERVPAAHMRAALLCMAFVSVAADYLGRELAFSDSERRKEFFKSGLIFGRPTEDTAKTYVGFAEQAVTDFVDKSGASATMLRMGFARAVERLPVSQFIEFFARPSAGRELYEAGLRLEEAAFSRNLPKLVDLATEAKVIIGLVADYADLDRRRLLGTVTGAPIKQRDRASTKGDADSAAIGPERLL